MEWAKSVGQKFLFLSSFQIDKHRFRKKNNKKRDKRAINCWITQKDDADAKTQCSFFSTHYVLGLKTNLQQP